MFQFLRSGYRSIEDTERLLAERIVKGELEFVLRQLHQIVERVLTEPLCTAQGFGSQKLDALCAAVGKRAFDSRHRGAIAPRKDVRTCVFLVTKLQRSGGHTRIIFDIIRSLPGYRHIILSTELDGKSDEDCVPLLSRSGDAVCLLRAPRRGFQDKLLWLQDQIVEHAPSRAYLFNHHSDPVAVAAIQPSMNLDAWFHHHGDHHLCLGVYLPHLKHIDANPTWYHHCRSNLGIENYYLPLTVQSQQNEGKRVFMSGGSLTTCTVGRANKIESPYFVSYVDVIPRLLKETGGRHIHIGRLTPVALRALKGNLKKLNVDEERFVYFPWKPSVSAALQEHGVDLYIDSFPYGGGLTTIEVMGAGVPVAMHIHMAFRQMCAFDLVYPGAFFWRHAEQLIVFCKQLTGPALQQLGQLSIDHYRKFYSWDTFQAALKEPGTVVAPSRQHVDFRPEGDEWVNWLESQVSARHLVRRGLYRVFRRLRSRLAP